MTESIKFGPEWLRNSVANVSTSSNSNAPPALTQDSITCRPVLSDHRYGREEMLSLCDKSTRLPDVLTRFRRLYVTEWQTPLALQPNTDDERTLGASATWGASHIRPLMPMGRGGTSAIRGGSIERGRGRGRGLYHGGAGYARSTSLYDEEGRRTTPWLDRNGTETTEWSGSGSATSPRKEFSRGMENWRKGVREEGGEVDWRSSSNGTKEKWTRSTSWRDGDASGDTSGPPNGQSSSPPAEAPPKPPAMYKKSWDEDHLPEWATESFDYGGTFDATGAFHDGERDAMPPDNSKPRVKPEMRQEGGRQEMRADPGQKVRPEMRQDVQNMREQRQEIRQDIRPEMVQNMRPEMVQNMRPEIVKHPDMKLNMRQDMREVRPEIREQRPELRSETIQKEPEIPDANPNPDVNAKYLDFLNESQQSAIFNGTSSGPSASHIDRMQEVADLVANLIMEDEVKDAKPQPGGPQLDWFYRDPQGDTQGPFTAQDMSEWYKAGYFQESLMVRRSIDNAFMPLGQLVKGYGRNAPFMAAAMMEPIQPPPPAPIPVEMDPYRRMAAPEVNGWGNMMTPEQQIIMLNMRLAHQRPPVPDPYVMKPQPVPDVRRMMGGEFFQAPNVPPAAAPEIDPIQQLLMQLQKTGGASGANEQWMKPPASQQQQQMMNELHSTGPPVVNQQLNQPMPAQLNQSQAPPANNWNQTPMSIWDMPKQDLREQHQGTLHNQQHHAPQEPEIMQNGNIEELQFQPAPSKSQEPKKKKQQLKEDLKKEVVQAKQAVVAVKKKPQNDKQQKKEERSTQPAAPAPWMGHQTPANSASLAKIQKTEVQRRQGEMVAQRERDHHKAEMMQKMDAQKNDGLKWAAPQVARVKTLDEIQAEEQKAAAIQAERDAVKREAAKKDVIVVHNDVSIWNSTPHSMAWQQPKVWSGEQQSGSGFWEEPTKPSSEIGRKNAQQMLSKSQTLATITTTKKPPQALKKQQAPPAKKPTSEKREKRDDGSNEFNVWCVRTLGSMSDTRELDVPTFVSFLQDIESPFEVKDYIKMYLGESKDCLEFARQFLERRSKQRNQQRLINAHIDDMCSPAPAITPSVNSGLSTDFQEVKGKNKKVKAKKAMKVVDGRILGFTATSASDRINVGDRDYGEV